MRGEIDIKVYYEDTDSLGVVYHANYLKFMERGRTELFSGASGKSLAEWNRDGYNFVVYKVTVTFRQPARLGDACRVVSETQPMISQYRLPMSQRILRGEELLIDAQVDLVCLDKAFALREFPPLQP